MSDDFESRITALEAENSRLREELSQKGAVAARALANYQHRALQMEIIRQQNEELSKLAAELDRARRMEEERGLEKLALIKRHENTIRALSTPILQIWSGVLALPLIGMIDDARAAELTEKLLEAIGRMRVKYAVLDVTGVDDIDAHSATHLIRMIRSVELMGAKGIITGIQPAVARTMISFGWDLSSILTLANLQDALERCIRGLSKPVPEAGQGQTM